MLPCLWAHTLSSCKALRALRGLKSVLQSHMNKISNTPSRAVTEVLLSSILALAVTTWSPCDLSYGRPKQVLRMCPSLSLDDCTQLKLSRCQSDSVQCVWSYLGVELRQLLFIEVTLGVDTSFIAELKHNKNKHKRLSCFILFACVLTA